MNDGRWLVGRLLGTELVVRRTGEPVVGMERVQILCGMEAVELIMFRNDTDRDTGELRPSKVGAEFDALNVEELGRVCVRYTERRDGRFTSRTIYEVCAADDGPVTVPHLVLAGTGTDDETAY